MIFTYSTIPGHTQLILILFFEYCKQSKKALSTLGSLTSIASLFVIEITAALAAQYAAIYSRLSVNHLGCDTGDSRALYVDTIPNWLAICTITPRFPALPS
jgi:hypothetical protein